MVSATDQQMAPGALYDCNLDFVRFEISLFIAFDKFVHVIFLIFLFSFSALVVLRDCVLFNFVFKRLGHSIGLSYAGPVRCPSRLRGFLP